MDLVDDDGLDGAQDLAAAGGGDEEGEPPVTLRQRAFPLLELLRNAVKESCGVMWDRE